MKKLILTLGLATLTLAGARADGTVNPLNGPGTAFRLDSNGNGVIDASDRLATAADGLRLGLFFGEADGPVHTLAGVMSIDETPGLLTGLPAIFAIPGTEEFQTVSMLVYAWQASYGDDPYAAWLAGSPTASTGVRQITLGAEAGPGTVIWQTATGTNPNRFTPLQFGLARPAPPLVPEPSTLALGALGGLALLWRSRSILRRGRAQR